MKVLIVSLFALMSTTAMAMPAVGDSATYQMNVNGMAITQKIELKAFNPSTNSFTQITTITYQGQTQQETLNVPASDLLSDAQADYILANCSGSEIGGSLETITTPAGTFSTCAVYESETSAKINVGKVPFGLVAISSTQLSGTLTGLTRGK